MTNNLKFATDRGKDVFYNTFSTVAYSGKIFYAVSFGKTPCEALLKCAKQLNKLK